MIVSINKAYLAGLKQTLFQLASHPQFVLMMHAAYWRKCFQCFHSDLHYQIAYFRWEEQVVRALVLFPSLCPSSGLSEQVLDARSLGCCPHRSRHRHLTNTLL